MMDDMTTQVSEFALWCQNPALAIWNPETCDNNKTTGDKP